MSTRDSGVIDLFAIHEEEEQRVVAAAPSAPPPAMAIDIDTSDIDPELFAAAQQKSRARTKIVGGIIGGFAVLGILIAAITTSGTREAPATAAAAAPPPVATVVASASPPPAAPVPMPAPPSTASGKAEYTPASAAAAYAATQPKKKGIGGKKIGANIKMQKIQSGGVN